ncbi:phytoene desaturase [Salsuginibacillus halophilus]|uniref:Phytoene desaturase n=1 Tax=Salsuginibacillus halophilus TaxID=517424 RepID=A0A2P8HY21_9BACI|nr:phytoene desaturase family protein [Salsuginibacillus halophilus]PSL51132.1 phytoene desaturase [Salsuginibacillus halophilus]
MTKREIAIIGAGPGGLAAGMLLSSWGYDVQVYEKQPFVGGRTSQKQVGRYTFDRGPTFFSMPHILDRLFQAAGHSLHEEVQLKTVEPMYELQFPEVSLYPSNDQDATRAEIARKFPGEELGFDRYMTETERKWEKLLPMLQSEHGALVDYLRPQTLKALPHLSLGRSLYGELARFFYSETLRLAFTFQSKYLGMSPWECPGAFSILSFMEHKYGMYHPVGGMHQLSEAMRRVIEAHGGVVHTDCGVEHIETKNSQIQVLHFADGSTASPDHVVLNADAAHAFSNLFDQPVSKAWHPDKVAEKSYSCSTFMMYAGVKKTFNEPHHKIVFSSNYKENVEDIAKRKVLSDDPSIYIQNGAVTDDTLSPKGTTPLYILAPVPNNESGIDWENEAPAFQEKLFDMIAKKTTYGDLRPYIEELEIIHPGNWEAEHWIYQGATFSLGHQLKQMMYFRPHNDFSGIGNLWLTGGGTHPGSGLPTIFESARITAEKIEQRHGIWRET